MLQRNGISREMSTVPTVLESQEKEGQRYPAKYCFQEGGDMGYQFAKNYGLNMINQI